MPIPDEVVAAKAVLGERSGRASPWVARSNRKESGSYSAQAPWRVRLAVAPGAAIVTDDWSDLPVHQRQRRTEVAWEGKIDRPFIGDASQDWDKCLLVRYPSRQHFLAMMANAAYREALDLNLPACRTAPGRSSTAKSPDSPP